MRLLDIGTTPFTFFVKEQFPHYEVSTVDLTNLMESRCKTRDIQFKVCDLDNRHVPFGEGYFDIVIFTEVLEHVFAPPTLVLKEIRRIMSNGGKLIMSVPNIAKLVHRAKFVFGFTPLPDPDDTLKPYVHGHGHIHEYTMREICPIIEGSNFTIDKKGFLGLGLFRTYVPNAKKRALLACYDAVCSAVPSFKDTLYFECRAR
jgi:SAM-dependent methyltransferase